MSHMQEGLMAETVGAWETFTDGDNYPHDNKNKNRKKEKPCSWVILQNWRG